MSLFGCECKCARLEERITELEKRTTDYKIAENALQQMIWKLRDACAFRGENQFIFPIEVIQKIVEQINNNQLRTK